MPGQPRGINRRFWGADGLGMRSLAADLAAWTYYEVVRQTNVPTISFMDIFLFLHLIPMIAAIGLRPHRLEGETEIPPGYSRFSLAADLVGVPLCVRSVPSQYSH